MILLPAHNKLPLARSTSVAFSVVYQKLFEQTDNTLNQKIVRSCFVSFSVESQLEMELI